MLVVFSLYTSLVFTLLYLLVFTLNPKASLGAQGLKPFSLVQEGKEQYKNAITD
jgi:hypothetical protein